MPYTPVLPPTYTPQTNRVDLHDALETLVDAYIAAASYTLGRQWQSSLPDSFTGEGPLIVLGDITETIRHDAQLRHTVFAGSLFYVDFITDRQETGARIDAWSDYMRDLFTYNMSLVDPAQVLVQVGFAEGEFTQGSLVFAAPSVIWEYRVQEGYR
jgi:hypothetical protein